MAMKIKKSDKKNLVRFHKLDVELKNVRKNQEKARKDKDFILFVKEGYKASKILDEERKIAKKIKK